GLAVTRIFQRRLIRGAREADCLRGDADTARIQYAHRDLETVTLLADHFAGLRDVIVELDFAGRRGADAEFGFGLAAAETLAQGVDHEGGDAARMLFGIGHREQQDVPGDRARGDPALLAVDHETAVRLLHRAAAHCRGVGPRLRLGERECADG